MILLFVLMLGLGQSCQHEPHAHTEDDLALMSIRIVEVTPCAVTFERLRGREVGILQIGDEAQFSVAREGPKGEAIAVPVGREALKKGTVWWCLYCRYCHTLLGMKKLAEGRKNA